MSSQYLNQAVPNQNINIKVNDAIVNGALSVVENSSFAGKLTVASYVASGSLILNGTGKISLPSLVNYTQIGSYKSCWGCFSKDNGLAVTNKFSWWFSTITKLDSIYK